MSARPSPKGFFLLLALLVSAPQAWPHRPATLAISNVTVIDVRSGSAHPDESVLITGRQITLVGAASKIKIPKTARVIDGRDRFLIPGLWDMHLHSGGDQGALRNMLAWGITGARDMGGDVALLTKARSKIALGVWAGPRLMIAGPMLKGPPSEADTDVWIIRSPAEAREAVDKLAALRVDFIKVHDDLSRDSFVAIASAAKAHGLPFAGHVTHFVTPAEASDLGERSIEHLEFLPKPCMALFDPGAKTAPSGCDPGSIAVLLQRLAHNRTWLDPTIQSFRYFAPTQWDYIFAEFPPLVAQIRQAHVKILAGTDWSSYLQSKGAPPGECLHDELGLLVSAGFTPAEALRASTLNSAIFLGLEQSLGTVQNGKLANLVLLRENPLLDIGNTKQIEAVFYEGKLVDGTALNAPTAK
jgi:imidazolonepropionase-like amidohydrolase